MGRLKELRKKNNAWRYEEMDNSKESLASVGENWLASRPAWQRRVLMTAGGVLVAAALIGVIAVSISTVMNTEVDDGYEDASSTEQDGSGEETQKSSSYSQYFFLLDYWSFLRSEETIASIEDQIYSKLLESGMEEGAEVYCMSDYEETDAGYRAWCYDIPREKYWQVEFNASDWTVEMSETDYASTPLAKQQAQINAEQAEDEQSESTEAAPTATAAPATTDAESHSNAESEAANAAAASSSDINASNGVALSDTSTLKNLLPERAAKNAATTLCSGAKNEYGVSAVAANSYVQTSSVKTTSSGCSFRVKMADQAGNSVVLDVTYNSSTNKFTGTEVK